VQTPLRATYPEIWTELAECVGRPEALTALDDGAFEARVAALRDHAALPMVLFGLGKGDLWQALPAERRARLAQEEGRYKAAAAVLWPEFESILDRWTGEGLTPCLLKGAHAALAFYPAPHLRPMSDIDALFTDLSEAERAFEMLMAMGYRETGMDAGGDPWATHWHLTALENRATGFNIEVHGCMIYPPKDKRAGALGCLWEDMSELSLNGRKVRGLSPEAFVVITFAHAFVAHGAEPPKFQAILDVAQVLKVTGDEFRWERLAELSATAGFAGAVSLGLTWTKDLLGSAIPEGFAERLAGHSSDRDKASGLVGDDYNNARFLETLRQAESLSARVGIVRHLTFPPGVWMRARYPEKARWPLPALYPYRWADQTRKVLRVLWAKLFS
jgi:hypothetical protein